MTPQPSKVKTISAQIGENGSGQSSWLVASSDRLSPITWENPSSGRWEFLFSPPLSSSATNGGPSEGNNSSFQTGTISQDDGACGVFVPARGGLLFDRRRVDGKLNEFPRPVLPAGRHACKGRVRRFSGADTPSNSVPGLHQRVLRPYANVGRRRAWHPTLDELRAGVVGTERVALLLTRVSGQLENDRGGDRQHEKKGPPYGPPPRLGTGLGAPIVWKLMSTVGTRLYLFGEIPTTFGARVKSHRTGGLYGKRGARTTRTRIEDGSVARPGARRALPGARPSGAQPSSRSRRATILRSGPLAS